MGAEGYDTGYLSSFPSLSRGVAALFPLRR